MSPIKVLFCLNVFLFVHTNSFAQSIVINEFVASNTFTITDNAGQYDDWIELYNPGTIDLNLNGYYITNDTLIKTKHQLNSLTNEFNVPANGYLLLWADNEIKQGGIHLNFKLDGNGGILALYSPKLELIDLISYTNQPENISFGRNLYNNWSYFDIPTPGKLNISTCYSGISGNVAFSPRSGIYNSDQNIILNKTQANDNIYYTLNNTHPTVDATQYSEPIKISKTSVIQSIAYQNDWISGKVQSELFIINESHALPILAIISDTSNFWGKKGIYTNFNSSGDNWERPCQLKLIADSTLKMESNAGIRIQGASSVGMPKKSFRLFFKTMYGNSQLEYPIFDSGKIDKFNKLVLKAGYDDDITTKSGTLLRDALVTEKWMELGGLEQFSKWVALYINNRYWGIYCIRENIDEDYIYDHTQLKEFDLIRFHNEGAELKFGEKTGWDEMFTFIKSADFSQKVNFEKVDSLIDMENFITLMALVQCTGYYSWGWGVSMYRPTNPVGKWKFSIWDADRAFLDKSWNGFAHARENTNNYQWANIFLKKLMKSPEFNRLFVNRICDLLNTNFLPENAIKNLDSLYNIIKPEMPQELGRWNPKNENWENNIQNLRKYLSQRPDSLLDTMRTEFQLSNLNTITVNVSGNGVIKVNGYSPAVYPWSGKYFENNAIDVEAIAKPGYKFISWDDNSNEKSTKRQINLSTNTSITATFEYDPYYSVENDIAERLKIYPNPANDFINIEFPESWKKKKLTLSIFNSNGQFISNIANATKTSHYNCSKLESGLYFIKIQSSTKTTLNKFVIIK